MSLGVGVLYRSLSVEHLNVSFSGLFTSIEERRAERLCYWLFVVFVVFVWSAPLPVNAFNFGTLWEFQITFGLYYKGFDVGISLLTIPCIVILFSLHMAKYQTTLFSKWRLNRCFQRVFSVSCCLKQCPLRRGF